MELVMTTLDGCTNAGNTWPKRFLALAREVASWSKDPSTKVGAIAVGPKGNVIAQGYNGFPRGIFDSPRRLGTKEVKYKYVVHAEMNVIYNASYNGVSLDGATLYVTGLPVCSECAKGIIQVGIRKIVMSSDNVPQHWEDSWKLSKNMLQEAGIEIVFIKD